MEILVKIGDREYPNHPNYDKTLRDGHVLEMRPDGYFKQKRYGYSLAVLRVPVDFSTVWGSSSLLDNRTTSALQVQKWTGCRACHDGKYPWEAGYVDPITIHSELNPHPKKVRRHEWFIDFKELLNLGLIDQTTYDSLYDFSLKTPAINIDRDFTQLLRSEESHTRLIPGMKNMAWNGSGGTRYVGSDGNDDYANWYNACDDLTTLAADATILGARSEIITETSIPLVDIDFSGKSLYIGVSEGHRHDGTYSGHRVLWSVYSGGFNVDEDAANTIGNLTIADLAFDCTAQSGTFGVRITDAGAAGSTQVIERCLAVGDSAASFGFCASYGAGYTCIIRNCIAYGFSYDAGLTTYNGKGFISYNQYSTNARFHFINNTGVGNRYNFASITPTPTGMCILKNNLAQGHAGYGDYGERESGGFPSHCSNISEDATSPDPDFRNMNLHHVFRDYDNNDFRLAKADPRLHRGAEKQVEFSDDIRGVERKIWYIGSCERVQEFNVIRSPSWQKPVRGTQLNMTHPLNKMTLCLPFNESGGKRLFDYANNKIGSINGTVEWHPRGLLFDGTTTYATIGGVKVPVPGSIAFRVYHFSESGNNYFFDAYPARNLWYAYGNDGRDLYIGNVRCFDGPGSGDDIYPNTWTDYCFTFRSGQQTLYTNGIAGRTSSASIGTTTPETFYLGCRYSLTEFQNLIYEYFYVFDKELTPAEVILLHREPYCMFQNTRRFRKNWIKGRHRRVSR